ncbi:hypothetical protein BGZ94_007770 [Podila epigama]|nr:hypothetical protein BGZ94_007770 [Podila epigama]
MINTTKDNATKDNATKDNVSSSKSSNDNNTHHPTIPDLPASTDTSTTGTTTTTTTATTTTTTTTTPAAWSNSRMSFDHLLFDCLLVLVQNQQATSKNPFPSLVNNIITHNNLITIPFDFFSDAFRVAIHTCHLSQTQTKVATASTYGKHLEESGLDRIEGVRSHAIQILGSSGVFPRDAIILSQSKTAENIIIRTLDPVITAAFEESYWTRASKPDMQMIAMILFQVATKVLKQNIVFQDRDRKLGCSIYIYGPRCMEARVHQRANNTRPTQGSEPTHGNRNNSNNKTSTLDHLTKTIENLQIVHQSATRTTFGLQGPLTLPTVPPTNVAFEAVTTAADAYFKV